MVEAVGGLVLLASVLLIAVLIARSKHGAQKAIVDRCMVDQQMADQARARFIQEQEQARLHAWYAAEAAAPRYCEGCAEPKRGSEMVWTIDGQYRCRTCAPEV